MARARLKVALAAAVGLAAAGAAGWWWWALHRPGPPVAVDLEVPPGRTTRGVLEDLAGADLLGSPLAGRLWLAAHGDGRAPRFGRYRFPPRTTGAEALRRLLAGEVETVEVTIVEGATARQISDAFVAAGLGSRDDWRRVLSRTDWIADLAPEASSLEGYLFPETYRFAVGLDADAAGRHLVSQFRRVWREVAARATAAPWGGVHEVVTLASLVEAETSVPEERSRIAGVFLNRLRRGMLLQCDPTVAYALERRGGFEGPLLRVHLTVDDPYNTYRYPGLPPGPINSPGRAALAAVLDPEEHRLLYFVARPEGGHTFSRTLADHNRAVARLRRSRN